LILRCGSVVHSCVRVCLGDWLLCVFSDQIGTCIGQLVIINTSFLVSYVLFVSWCQAIEAVFLFGCLTLLLLL
jgi:hypothetical protein